MKTIKISAIFIFLIMGQLVGTAMAKTVLISGFDAFQGRSINNSTVIGKLLEKSFEQTDIKVVFCPLRTIYFEGSQELKDCINSQPVKPDYVLSLGEAKCRNVKFETKAVNIMSDRSGDNAGISYSGEPIRTDAPQSVRMSLDLKPLKKKLPLRFRKYVTISDNAGRFVCNNTAFIMSLDLDIPYAFIHVPAGFCSKSKKLVSRSVKILERTIRNLP